MSKKLITLLSVLMLFALFLGACASAPEATEEAAPEATEEMAEPTAEPTEEMAEPTEEMAEPTEVMTEEAVEPVATIRIWADETRAPILNNLADAFFDAYQVELVVEEVSGMREQFIIAAPAGEGPDIILGAHDWIGGLIASGLLAPIDLGDKTADFVPLSLDAFTYTDGQLYGMPYATENLGFFYNTDLVDTPPATWDEALQIARDLQAAGEVTYAFGLHGTSYDFLPIQTAFGGYVFGKDDQGNWNANDLGIGSQGTIDAAAWTRAAIEEGLIPSTIEGDTDVILFESGESAFLIAGPWFLDRIRESGVPYAVAPFPAATEGGDPGAPFLGVQGFMVNAFSENVLLAQAFLTEFVATSDVMEQLYLAGNRPSAYIPVLEATSDPDLAGFGQAGANATLMPYIPEMGSVWGAWGAGVSTVINGESTPEDGMTTAQNQIKDLILGALAGMVNVPGSYQDEAGCGADWDPACVNTALEDNGDGTYSATYTLPAGDYEFKVALDGSWAVNYGSDGAQDGPNYTLSLDAESTVTFTYDSETKLITVTVE